MRIDTDKYPKTWEEFIQTRPVGDILYCVDVSLSKAEAEAVTALAELRQLRKAYVGEWQPPYGKDSHYVIERACREWKVSANYGYYYLFTFPDKDLANLFLDNFQDLFTKIEPLFR